MNLYNLFKLSSGKKFRMLAMRYELHLYLLLQKRDDLLPNRDKSNLFSQGLYNQFQLFQMV